MCGRGLIHHRRRGSSPPGLHASPRAIPRLLAALILAIGPTAAAVSGGLAARGLAAKDLAAKDLAALRDRTVRVGFLLIEGVYNTELVAPYDVFQHTSYHTKPGMRVFTVGRTKDPVRTFEGLRIAPDYALDDAPAIDVLVVPSAEHNLDTDLEDTRLIAWVAERGARATRVLSLCDGAFVLAKAGLLEGLRCTTFPADIPRLRRLFPSLSVEEGVSFVADGGAITSAGGVRSYDAALFLVERLWGGETARGIAGGLVLDWDLDAVKHLETQVEVQDAPPGAGSKDVPPSPSDAGSMGDR